MSILIDLECTFVKGLCCQTAISLLYICLMGDWTDRLVGKWLAIESPLNIVKLLLNILLLDFRQMIEISSNLIQLLKKIFSCRYLRRLHTFVNSFVLHIHLLLETC